jgi:hypothetical protein
MALIQRQWMRRLRARQGRVAVCSVDVGRRAWKRGYCSPAESRRKISHLRTLQLPAETRIGKGWGGGHRGGAAVLATGRGHLNVCMVPGMEYLRIRRAQ